MTEKQKEMLMDGVGGSGPEVAVILGTVVGHYTFGIPVWALGLIALAALAGKIYWNSRKK